MTTPRRPPAQKAGADDALAWELAAVVCPYLRRADTDDIYIAIGIGETFAAIAALICALVLHQIPVSAAQAATVAAWLDRYRGHETEARLRHLIAELNIGVVHHMPASTPPRVESSGDVA
jgi:hypothetical protein